MGTVFISSEDWRELAKMLLFEDKAKDDITTALLIDENLICTAEIIAEGEYIIAGLEGALECFKFLDENVSIEAFYKDGDEVKPGSVVARIIGRADAILKAERSALNLLAHLSGIATKTAEFVKEAKRYGIEVFDTRKTRPLLRKFEKYAVSVAGGKNHRMNLEEAVFVKDNHKKILGGIKAVAKKLRSAEISDELPVIVEVENLDELAELSGLRIDVVILDNFSIDAIEKAVKRFGDKFVLEVSGGVGIENLPALAKAGVKRVSTSSTIMKAISASFKLEVN